MSSDDRIRKQRNFRNPMLILGLAMTITYFILGIVLLMQKAFLPGIPKEFRNILAGLLIVYGIFRGWRVYKDYF